MKSQMDWIVSGVSVVLAFIIALIWMETKRTVVKPADPTPSTADSPLSPPVPVISMNTALPGASMGMGSGTNENGMGMRGGRMGGGPGGPGGPGGGGKGGFGGGGKLRSLSM
jgi:hypothetical protein